MANPVGWIVQRVGTSIANWIGDAYAGDLAIDYGVPQDVAQALGHRWVAEQARSFLKNNNDVQALAHFDYFLSGKAKDYPVSVSVFLRSDFGARRNLGNFLVKRLASGVSEEKGRFWITQPMFSTEDWRYALGSLPMDYEITRRGRPPGGIRSVILSFRNRYSWHERNETLGTLPLHQTLKALIGRKEVGVKLQQRPYRATVFVQDNAVSEFDMVGPPLTVGEDQVKSWATSNVF